MPVRDQRIEGGHVAMRQCRARHAKAPGPAVQNAGAYRTGQPEQHRYQEASIGRGRSLGRTPGERVQR